MANPVGSETDSLIADHSASGDDDFSMGLRDGGNRPWMGNLDEVRVMSTVRSAEWVQTEFNNQSNPGDQGNPGFYMIGPETNPDGDTPTDWYVDGNYSGTETGSASQPFNTIGEAINAASGGHTIHIKGNYTYNTEKVYIGAGLSGSEGNETTFQKWAGAEDNPVVYWSSGSAVEVYASYLIWDSINVTSPTAGGNHGIAIYTSNVTIQNSTIYDCESKGIRVASASNTIIRNCTLYNNTLSSGAIELRADSSATTIERCLIRDNLRHGIAIYTTNNIIYNNTIDGNDYHGILIDTGVASGNEIYNNIISNNAQVGIRDLDTTNDPGEDYNCLYNNTGGNYTGFTLGANSIETDPLYVDRTNKNFHLQSTSGYYPFGATDKSGSDSPAIDAGQVSGSYSDYSNEPEDNGDRVNLGAYGNTAEASLSGSCSYNYSRSIKIDGDEVGGSSGYLTDFPVLVNLSGSWLQTAPDGNIAHPSGWDIIFRGLDDTTCNGTAPCDLDFEIETYDGSTGKLVAWVRVPQVYAGNGDPANDTVIYMYYGSACVTADPQNATGVWDSNYKGVWHLAEKYGLDFDGANSYVDTGYKTHHAQTTIEAWIYLEGWGEGWSTYELGRVIDKRVSGDQTFVLYLYNDTTDAGPDENLRFERNFSGGIAGWATPDNSLALNNWYHIAVTYDDSDPVNEPAIYINGQPQSLTVLSTATGTANTNTDDYLIGNRGAGDRNFDGIIDDLRIYSRILTSEEINDLYLGKREPSRDGLVIEYLMDEGSGDIVLDSSGNGHHGDMTGHLAEFVRPRAHDSTANSNFGARGGLIGAPAEG